MDLENESEVLEMKDVDTEDTAPTKNPNSGLLYYLMYNHLWIFAIWVVPISVIYDIFWWFRTRMSYWICKRNATSRHDEKVLN